MEIEWDDTQSMRLGGFPGGMMTGGENRLRPVDRLDLLLPADPETGVVTFAAFRTYLGAMMQMVYRAAQPLSLICLAVDETPSLREFGAEGASLIGRAVARCIRQETRGYDVAGRTEETDAYGLPAFLVVCPLLQEANMALLAERLRVTMTAHAVAPDRPCLTLSVGVASMSIDAADPEALLARAKAALQRARREGGGRVWRHSDTQKQIVESERQDPFNETS